MRKKISLLLTVTLLFALAALASCSRGSKSADAKFEAYTDNLFCQEVSSNTISLHYTLENPSDYGIDKAPVSFGSCSTDTAAISASAENALASLHAHNRAQLSDKNKLTYDILDNYLSTSLDEAGYVLYDEPLAPLTGTQAQLPVLLSEYQFNSAGDIDTYLTLMTKLPEYFESIIAFEQAKSEKGLFMASYSADDIIDECNAFIKMGDDNYLYSSFTERLDAMKLDKADHDDYVKRNRENIKEYIYPSYKKLADSLKALRTTGKNNNGLCYLPDGRDYYELVVKRETGSSRTVNELKELTQSQILEDLTAMQQILTSSSKETFSNAAPSLEDTDPTSILSNLKAKLKGSFPDPPDVSTEIKYVQKSMEEYLSPAFFMVPAIDSTTNNVIYINQGHMPDDLSLFTTLAHEGYPGHLYQTVYFQNLKPDPIRNLLNFGGYTEGWATYTEMLSYYYAPLPKEQAALLQRNTSVILGLYALADMGIHYDGWKLADTVSFFRQYGIEDANTVESIYDLIISDPANYLKYYIGYVEFMELKKEAIDKWGESFTQENFHKKVLTAGPAPFDILRTYMFQ
ncbi:DUF885 domain-containing protein [[Clostridium] hylemonae]|uniref:DUF885 domain-containing protein n=1 Tax=[Clostridium] hylemonae TaxID=89153 RepID=UPI001106D821|nr:DUF885 domain-containing protein [[Clostridium] hylemonae]